MTSTDSDSPRKYNSTEDVFIEFQYPELKDLGKHFLTLISGALLLSVTFSDKVIDLAHAPKASIVTIICSWGALVLSLGACGWALYCGARAVENAVWARDLECDKQRFIWWAVRAFRWANCAGLLFGIGLCLMVASAIIRYYPVVALTAGFVKKIPAVVWARPGSPESGKGSVAVRRPA